MVMGLCEMVCYVLTVLIDPSLCTIEALNHLPYAKLIKKMYI